MVRTMETVNKNEIDLKKLKGILGSYIATRTAPSLSTILGEPVQNRVRRVVELDFADLESIIPVFDDFLTMCGVYLKCEGDVRLGMLFFLPKSEAKDLAAKLLGVKNMRNLSVLGRSSISEVGNMMAGSFFNALSDGTGFRVESSVPGFAIDTYKTLLETPTAEIASTSNKVIVADAELQGINSGMKIHIMIILDPKDARILVNPRAK